MTEPRTAEELVAAYKAHDDPSRYPFTTHEAATTMSLLIRERDMHRDLAKHWKETAEKLGDEEVWRQRAGAFCLLAFFAYAQGILLGWKGVAICAGVTLCFTFGFGLFSWCMNRLLGWASRSSKKCPDQ